MRKHIPTSDWCITLCAQNCAEALRSPFPPRNDIKDPDGLGTFAVELARELGVDFDEISITDVARAWARAHGWREHAEGWDCPRHTREVTI